MPYQLDPAAALRLGQAVLQQEAEALHMIADRIGDDFVEAVRILLDCRGRLVVSGVGKSGHIGRKLAATFASTGTPAFFVHAAEAAHGDLGMITSDDVVLAISYSGETNELLTIVPTLKREGALGDALAVSCLSAKGFSKEDFARSHPGGALGRRLLLHVSDVMRSGDAVPFVTADTRVLDAVRVITKKHIGMTAIVDADHRVLGIFTEGDLRRLIEARGDIRPVIISEVMTRSPAVIRPEELAAQAVRILNQRQCNQLLVVDGENRLVGALHMHDLVNAKVL